TVYSCQSTSHPKNKYTPTKKLEGKNASLENFQSCPSPAPATTAAAATSSRSAGVARPHPATAEAAMARQEAAGAATGVDFHLPDEILAVIPTDPYEQLDVARKITSMAIASRVSRLEADVARLRRDLADRDRGDADLRARLADSDARLLAALDENAKLVKERDTLALTAKKLSRNLAKLEAFKKQLMKSLSEDNLLQLSETGEDRDVDAENSGTARSPSWKGVAQPQKFENFFC
uniref:Uncharacterized protein n=1 Tax=Aegilops tauschii subsp. strangulata TaxID=200361 RepID=A0A453CQQ8_AEGTS